MKEEVVPPTAVQPDAALSADSHRLSRYIYSSHVGSIEGDLEGLVFYGANMC